MSSFTEQKGYIVAKGNKWATTRNFKFYINDSMEGEYIEVPTGYETDGCSTICPFGQKVEPSTISSCILHNFMFSEQMYSFTRTNLIFYNAMRVEGTGLFKRILYFIGVMTFGYLIWNYKKYFKNKKK